MLVAADDECIGVSLRNNGAFEEALLLDVVRYLNRERGFRPTLFVDIGANIGTHLLRALAEGLFGRGIAIEMDSFNYNLLVSNVALNGYTERTTLYKVALSDAECELTMEMSGGNRGDHRLRGEGSESHGGPEDCLMTMKRCPPVQPMMMDWTGTSACRSPPRSTDASADTAR
jgi:hypothetical protein